MSILEIIIGIYYCTKASYTSGIILLLLGIFIAILGYTAKDFQRYVLKKSEKLLDKSFRSGIVEYTFDTKGITISSNIGESINYWNAFKEYGTFGEYIYVKRKDNKMILIDKNDLTVIYHNNILLLKQGKTYYGKGKHNNETHMVRNSKHFDDAFPPISRNIDTKKLKQKTDVCFPQISVVKPRAGKTIKL